MLAESLHDRLSRLGRQLRGMQLPRGMTPERMSVLSIVHSSGPISVSALAQYERVRPATMSRMVSSLESEGYVERLSDETDGRGVLVVTTQRGFRALSVARQQRLARLSAALDTLPEEQLGAMSDLAAALEKLTAVLDAPDAETPQSS